VRKHIDDGVLLVGDAAGLAYPQSGEGIRPAVESGLMAAATILGAQGAYGRDALLPYSARLATRFGSAVPPAPGGPSFMRKFFGAMLLENRWFTRHVVLDRWFLHGHQPALEAI
jgi:hypothetical protein